MLSDKEKILVKKLRYCEQEYEQNGYLSVGKFEAIKEAANLIEKQQKEIERLNNKFEKIYNEIDNKNSQLVKALNYKLFIEDKIKAKIEDILNSENSEAIEKLIEWQSLLEKE